ncbi:MAG: carboxypeptidase regulatory-like domain-containing protein [Edaphobacter sp.]
MTGFIFGMRMKCQRKLLCGLLATILFAFPAALLGQGYFGTVGGVLTDSTGSVVPGAKLTLLDEQKGFKFSQTSDKAGQYLYRSIPPGVYTVTAEMPGFEKTVRTGVRVNVSENATANLSLKVAGAVQTVQVEAQAQTLDTQDATTGQVINRRFINNLPLTDRSVMDLTSLTPGVTEADDQCGTNCTGTNFISNGSRNSTADVLMDGASITNFEPNGGITKTTYTPSIEAVEEFKVQQSNFSAEYGFSGASVVNMITRSGTNAFHGSVYDFLRDQVFDANDWFNNHYGVPIAALRRNNFGVTVGGPIIKDKTFFFFDYDGTRETSMSTHQAGVPSAVERNGDFGEVCGANGGTFDSTGLCSVAQGQIWDPYSGAYDPNAGGAVRSVFIPFNNVSQYASPGNPKLNGTPYQLSGGQGDLIDPVAQKMMNLFPTPNIPNGTIYDNWIGSGPNKSYNDQFDIKIDQRFSQKNLLSAKYSQNWNHNTPYNCFGNFADPCGGGPNTAHAYLFSLNDTHTFSPTLLLNVTLGFTRGTLRQSTYDPAGGVTDPLAKLGMPAYLNSNGFPGVPTMVIGGGYFMAAGQSIGSDPYGNYKQGQNTGQLTIALSKQLGSQELKFGLEGRLHQQNYIQTNSPNGTFNFDQGGSSQCPGDVSTCGGDGLATFMMGYPNAGGYYEIQIQPATQNYQYAGYVQDNWRANSKLTVNVGLRYDVSLPKTDRHNRLNWFDPNALSPLQVPGLGSLHGGEVFASSHQRTITDTDWKDIQPRFGFSYQFAPQTVVRGGYGIYYTQTKSGANGVGAYGTQGFNQNTNLIPTYQNDLSTPYLHLSNPYPNGLIQPPGSSLGLMNDVGYGANGPLRNVKNTPYEQTWSLGIERQLPWNMLLGAEYIGKKGTHLYFSGSNHLNILGPEIEGYSADQIAALNSQVPNPFYNIITDPNSTLSAPQVQQYQLQLPYPQFTGVAADVFPTASSIYHGLQLTAQKNYSNGLQLLVTYVWSKSIDDSSAQDDNVTWLGSFTSLQDPNKPQLERSLSTFDIPQVLQFSYTYDLPVGRGKAFLGNTSRVLDAIVGGWVTNGVWRMSSGRPLSFTTADGISLPTYGPQRPNITGTPHRNHGHDWIDNYFTNPGVLVLPQPFTLGNAPRAIGSVRTPSKFNADLSMMKLFSLERLRSGMKLEFRLEASNALNHPTFGTPNTSVDDPSFGTVSYTSSAPRQMQLGLKAIF